MTTATAVHTSTNGSYANLSSTERLELVNKLRMLVKAKADATIPEMIKLVSGLGLPMLESMPSQFGLSVNYKDDEFNIGTRGHHGTEALCTAITVKLEALLAEPSADSAPVAAEAPVADAPKAPAKPRKRKPKGKKHNGVPTAMATQTMAPLPPAQQQVIQALKDQRAGADANAQNLLDNVIRALERNDQITLEVALTQAMTNNTVMKMFGILWGAMEDTHTRYAMFWKEVAKLYQPRASFLEGIHLLRESAAQIRERLASANPGMAVAPPEHDVADQPGS